jgi:hypothetical protein
LCAVDRHRHIGHVDHSKREPSTGALQGGRS